MGNSSKFNDNLIPKELNMIFELVKEEDDKRLHDYVREKAHRINWQLFLELTIHHRVYPVLAAKLQKMDETIIPAQIKQYIIQLYRENTFRMLHLSSEMENVNRLLNQNQVRLLFLKGPFLGTELYGDLSLRTSGDLDLLIPIEDLMKVDKLLVDQGYQKDDYIQTVLNDWKWRHHHFTYFHPQRNVKLEVHWRLNPGPGKEPSFDALWERKKKSDQTGFPVLGNEDLFLFLVSHGARHGWSRLRWLLDIDRLVKMKMDWKFLNRLLKKHHFLDIGGQAIILSSRLLGTCIPKYFHMPLKRKRPSKLAQEAIFYIERMVNLHADPIPEEVAKYHKRHLFSLMSVQQKILFMISCLHPYPTDMETLPLPKSFHLLYFPLRPFLLIWRRAKNHA